MLVKANAICVFVLSIFTVVLMSALTTKDKALAMPLEHLGEIALPDQVTQIAWSPDSKTLIVNQPWRGGFRRLDLSSSTVSDLLGKIGAESFEWSPRASNVTVATGLGVSILDASNLQEVGNSGRVHGCSIDSGARPTYSRDNDLVWVSCRHIAVPFSKTSELAVAIGIDSRMKFAPKPIPLLEFKNGIATDGSYISINNVRIGMAGSQAIVFGHLQVSRTGDGGASTDNSIFVYEVGENSAPLARFNYSSLLGSTDALIELVASDDGTKLAMRAINKKRETVIAVLTNALKVPAAMPQMASPAQTHGLRKLAFSRDGILLFGGCAAPATFGKNLPSGRLLVWKSESGELIQTLDVGPIYDIAMNSDGSKLAIASEARVILFRVNRLQ